MTWAPMRLIDGNPMAPTRILLTIVALAAATGAAGCGGGSTSPPDVVRAWSKAVNRGDNEAAARLFGPRVKFVAGDYVTVVRGHERAVAFNAGLGWCGPIVRLVAKGTDVTAQFALATRAAGRCTAGRERGSVFFRIRHGKIVLFDQIGA